MKVGRDRKERDLKGRLHSMSRMIDIISCKEYNWRYYLGDRPNSMLHRSGKVFDAQERQHKLLKHRECVIFNRVLERDQGKGDLMPCNKETLGLK